MLTIINKLAHSQQHNEQQYTQCKLSQGSSFSDTVYTGCIMNTESGFLWLSRTFYVRFPGPIMSIFHVFPGLFNRVDIEQVRFSYNTEYVTQFIIILNNRSNRVWQWTMTMYVKAENMYMGQKCSNHLLYFPWLSRI